MLARTPHHPVCDMPSCVWAGHRYTLLKEEAGMYIEVCMDCGGRPRAFPIGGHAGQAKIIDFPPTELDQQIGGGGL